MRLLKNLNKSENNLAILFAVVIISMCYPYGFPVFTPLAIFFVELKALTGKFKIRVNTGFILFSLCIFAYFIGMSLNGGYIYSHNISDITKIIGYFFVWVLLSDIERDKYPVMLDMFAKFVVIGSSIISILALFKFYQLLRNIYIDSYYVGNYYPGGTSLVPDYNMFSLALTSGLIMCAYLLPKANNLTHFLYYFFSFISIFSTIIFAGSRRGWVATIIVILFVFLLLFKALINMNKNTIKTIKYGLAASIAILLICLLLILLNVDLNIQNSDATQSLLFRFKTLQPSQASESFSARTDRWYFAGQIINEYSPIEFFIGSGFDYLPEFANKFCPDLKEDYPHNPLISSMLYSGLIGLILILGLLIWSIISVFRNIKTIGIYFTLLFIISWMFVIISSNSIFSISFFILMLLLVISVPKQQSIIVS